MMNQIFGRLCIGTANWGKKYNGVKVPESEQEKILEYCKEVGIDMIDTATAYEWDWTKVDPYFKVVVKVKKEDAVIKPKPYCVMAHDGIQRLGIDGISLYEPRKFPEPFSLPCARPKVIQIPYSLYDRRAEPYFAEWKIHYDAVGQVVPEIHVRSVFLRGKILEDFSPYDCIVFCLMNPYIDRVILGADSYDQFVYNLAHLDKLCNSQVDDENIIDPRKWKDEKWAN